ncbi:PREDICTED: uncharacterized protein LOC104588110 [Nelumbo nucifera]|uniref:Uncharacterized protein LOC104588110 n=1 Tax=Nelumbo nucifera TaxID=4432 RepID=A0A1U7Z962_NELNU|nr:PREDICTED: uncharacterized protein LOC104588110 [Nelumbo nucifera]
MAGIAVPNANRMVMLSEENYVQWREEMMIPLQGRLTFDPQNVLDQTEPQRQSIGGVEDAEALELIQRWCGPWAHPYVEALDSSRAAWVQLASMYDQGGRIKSRWIGPNPGRYWRNNYSWCLPLYEAICSGKWEEVLDFFQRYVDPSINQINLLTSRLTVDWDTSLHIAAKTGNEEIVKCMLTYIIESETLNNLLESQNKDGKTVLHIAASGGNLLMAKAMVEECRRITWIRSEKEDYIPILEAGKHRNRDMVIYLFDPTLAEYEEHLKGEKDAWTDLAAILTTLITLDLYGKLKYLMIIFKVFQLDLMSTTAVGIQLKQAMLKIFQAEFKSRKPAAGNPVESRAINNNGDIENLEDTSRIDTFGSQIYHTVNQILLLKLLKLWKLLQKILNRLISPLKKIYHTKLTHKRALELLQNILVQVSQDNTSIEKLGLHSAIFDATKSGIVEFISEIIPHPKLISICSVGSGQSIFHVAITHRQVKIFNLIHKIGPLKNDLSILADNSKNCMLHFVGKWEPTNIILKNQVRGAALQVQSELQWFEAVKSIMPRDYENFPNNDGQTPRLLFTENHKELVIAGEKWMRSTAKSCLIVATLIATVVYQAAFTVPGGEDNGIPFFSRHTAFMSFIFSDAVALFSSSTSVLLFLAILTSRYKEEDFLESLPNKLIFGLFSLFISIVAMMAAFFSAILITAKSCLFHTDVLSMSDVKPKRTLGGQAKNQAPTLKIEKKLMNNIES